MKDDKLLTAKQVSEELGMPEQEIIDLVEKGIIPAYKIGGVYLRFKPEQIEEARRKVSRKVKARKHKQVLQQDKTDKAGFIEALQDFFYFNGFYILALLIIMVMLFIIFRA